MYYRWVSGCLAENTVLDWIDGRLSPAARARAAAHIDACSDCRTFVAEAAKEQQQDPAALCITEHPIGVPDSWEPPPSFDGFQIVRFLGRGAMGQVYEARDMELDRAVAIKFLCFREGSKGLKERFRIEARAVARVQHVGVVQVFRTGEVAERPYLVSEFVEGTNLGGLPRPIHWREAMRIGQALASALAAAHRQGVLHRDIKPANVMLAASGEVKLLDFGLAKLLGPSVSREPEISGTLTLRETAVDSLTRTGAVMGTPRYMAPELWEGAAASERSDVYALGAVLYELCSGHPPHTAGSVEELRRQLRNVAPRPLEHLVVGIDKRFAHIVDQCLDRAVLVRPESGQALHAALTKAFSPPGLLQKIREYPVRLSIGAIAILTTASLAYWGVSGFLEPHDSIVRSRSGAPGVPVRKSVAVLGFDNHTGEDALAWFDTALMEALHGALSYGEQLRVISTDGVVTLRRELNISELTKLDQASWQKVRAHLGAERVIRGWYTLDPKSRDVQLQIELIDPAKDSGKVLSRTREVFPQEDVLAAALRAGNRLRRELGVGSKGHEIVELRAALPRNPQVAEQYLKGLSLNRAMQHDQARAVLEKAIHSYPREPLLHSALSQVWASLGYDKYTREEAALALEFADVLPEETTQQLKAAYLYSSYRFNQAAHEYEHLYKMKPHIVEYAQFWLNSLLFSSEPSKLAIDVMKIIENGTPNSLDLPSMRSARGLILALDPALLPAALREVQLGVSLARERGEKSAVAVARLHESRVLIALRQYSDAAVIIDEIVPVFQLFRMYREYRQAIIWQAFILHAMRQNTRSALKWEEAITVSRDTHGTVDLYRSLRESAVPTAKASSVDVALNRLDEAEQLNLQIWGPGHLSQIPALRDTVWLLGGRLNELLPYDIKQYNETPQNEHLRLAEAAWSLGAAYMMHGDMDLAQRRMHAAVDAARASPSDEHRYVALRWLAELELVLHRWKEAEGHAKEAASFAEAAPQADQAMVRAVWSRALAGCGRWAEASEMLKVAKELSAPSDNLRTRLLIAMTEASLAETHPSRPAYEHARRILTTALSEAEKVGLWYDESTLHLMMVNALRGAGLRKKSIQEARILLKKTQDRHFIGIARDTRSLLRRLHSGPS